MSLLTIARNAIPTNVEHPYVGEHATDPAPTLHEEVSHVLVSSVGDLGYLFDHLPGQYAVPTPLEDGPQGQLTPAGLDPQTYANMTQATTLAAGPTDQLQAPPANDGGPVGPVAPRWTFSDTLRNELLKAQQRIVNVVKGGAGASQ